MIRIQNTPNLLGVTTMGDIYDFDELYDALHTIVGEEFEYPDYESVRLRVLGVCYDIRHAMMGNRGAEHVPNGLTRDHMQRLSIMGSEMNIYLNFETYWPEMLFVCYALNDFIAIRVKDSKIHSWDPIIATVRKFQAAVAKCLQETLTPNKYAQLRKYITPANRYYTTQYGRYATQYLDKLNLKFIEMDRPKREKNLSIFAKRLGELDEQYYQERLAIYKFAKENDISPDQVRNSKEYPDHIEW